MSKNPFGQLNVHRDDDDEIVAPSKQASNSNPTSLFPNISSQKEEKPKKKVRPEEKKQIDQPKDEEPIDGFEVVKKNKPVNKQRTNQSQEVGVEEKQKDPNRKNKTYSEKYKPVPGKRQFDRHSGTGRGKEIAKQGAGGKGTWGTNNKSLAQNEEKNIEFEEERYGRYEDKCNFY